MIADAKADDDLVIWRVDLPVGDAERNHSYGRADDAVYPPDVRAHPVEQS